jgi:ABC-2 type transport system ATP-binding protein
MDNSQNSDYSIQTINLTRKFGNIIAVNRLNLAIKKGELFSLLGHNGAGKTTTIKMLSCLLKPTSGTALILGHDIKKEADYVKRIINVSPQETAIASHLTPYENLQLIARLYDLSKANTRSRTEELIELMGLKERAEDRVEKLSGGMQRRLSIAMALISDPKVLFLDEPTLGLDPRARRNLWEQIEKLKGNKTIILTTHYMEEAEALSDRIAIIKSGCIEVIGTPMELKAEFSGQQTMIVRGRNLTDEIINNIKMKYRDVKFLDNGIEIRGENLVFDEIVDSLRSNGVKIEWLTMKEASLDDVFLGINEEV